MPLEHAIAIVIGVVLALLAAGYAFGVLSYPVEEEPSEFGAGFDALQHERERLDEIKRKSHATEKLIEAQRVRAMLGPAHDPVEL